MPSQPHAITKEGTHRNATCKINQPQMEHKSAWVPALLKPGSRQALCAAKSNSSTTCYSCAHSCAKALQAVQVGRQPLACLNRRHHQYQSASHNTAGERVALQPSVQPWRPMQPRHARHSLAVLAACSNQERAARCEAPETRHTARTLTQASKV